MSTPKIQILGNLYQTKTDSTLETTDKTIVGAINEINTKVGTGSSKVTDLTGTTWDIPVGWTATAGYGSFSVNYDFSLNDAYHYTDLTSLQIGYTFDDVAPTAVDSGNLIFPVQQADNIIFTKTTDVAYRGYSTIPFSITFTGGTDVTNTDLISWLYANGELHKGEIDLSAYQTKTDESLVTLSKEIVGAINEVEQSVANAHSELQLIQDGYEKVGHANLADELTGQTNLETTSKEVIGAINEVNQGVTDAKGELQLIQDGYTKVGHSEIADKLVGQANLETETKEIVGAINEVNGKTIDKIALIDAWAGEKKELLVEGIEGGINWTEEFTLYDKNQNPLSSGEMALRVPLVAGENVTFEIDEDGLVVKINATGGGGSENVVSKFTIPTEASTTVVDMIIAIQNAGGNISEWNIINLTGYTTATFGLMISNYGGTVYNIQGTNLVDMTVISNTQDWSGVTLGAFTTMFQPVLPPCDANNEGQFLMVVGGVPTWTTVPNAEGVGF